MILRILIEAMSGLILMTAFSYAVSLAAKKWYKEPELLNDLMRRWNVIPKSASDEALAGFVVHYASGVAFAVVYEMYWHFKGGPDPILDILWLGLASGIFGVCVWKLMFGFTRHKPQLDFNGFYLQLVPAHVFFVIGVVFAHLLMR